MGYAVAQFVADENILVSTAETDQQNKNTNLTENDLDQLFKFGINQQSNNSMRPTSNQVSKINVIISEASPENVDRYLNQAFPEADLLNIKDKKKFAQRAIE